MDTAGHFPDTPEVDRKALTVGEETEKERRRSTETGKERERLTETGKERKRSTETEKEIEGEKPNLFQINPRN